VLEDHVPGGAAEHLRGRPPRVDLRPDQHRGRRVPDQLRRARPAHQRTRRALRSARHLRGDLLRRPHQRAVLRRHGKGRTMAETGRLTRAPTALPAASPVFLLRLAIIAAILVAWEALSRSGLLFRDVVPSLLTIGQAVLALLLGPDHAWPVR